MSAENPEYDFKWCPGCGDFGVRRALESAIQQRHAATGIAIENNVVVAGIGCSGNMVHLLEGDQPFGISWSARKNLADCNGCKND